MSYSKVALLSSPGNILLENRIVPEVGKKAMLLEVVYCGICGTDLKLYQGKGPFSLDKPIVPGHEFVARVHTVGKEVKQFTKGQRVVVNPVSKYIGLGGYDGAFAKFLFLPDVKKMETAIYPVPENISDELATLTEPLAVALHGVNKVIHARDGEKEKVFISGAGPIGLCTLAAFRAKGVKDIIVADPNPNRRAIAIKMGASFCFDPLSQNVSTFLKNIHGSAKPAFLKGTFSLTTIFAECSGNPKALQTAISTMGENSKLLVLAAKGKIDLDIAILQAKGGQIITSIVYKNEFPEALKLLEEKITDLSPMITHIMDLEDIQDAFDLLCRKDTPAAKVLIKP